MYTVFKLHNENETSREGQNGRIYSGVIGWRWYIKCNDDLVGDFYGYKTKREAIEEIEKMKQQKEE